MNLTIEDYKMKLVKFLLVFSAMLCFFSAIWSQEPIKYILTGLYALAVYKYIGGKIFEHKTIGSVLDRKEFTIDMVSFYSKNKNKRQL